ncbi:MAG: PIN domain-containing protein [Bryobacterales bacterium]|nr:PIN domain-containing protein [Bryobacterales bacterium]
MRRTFLDSGVLLSAIRSAGQDREQALQLLEDPDCLFLTSPFVHLELVPKAQFHKKRLEVRFYEEYFRVAEWCRDLERVARREAVKSGLSAMDALHVAAAYLVQADELVTTGRPEKPLFRTMLVKVKYLFS